MRVSTYFNSQSVLQQIQLTQSRQLEDQRQVATGLKANDYEGLGRNAAAVLSAHTIVQRTQSYVDVSKEVASRLQIQDANLGAIGDATTRLIDRMREAVSSGNGAGLMDDVQNTFGTTMQALNVNYAGQYLFGGTRTDQPPFTAGTLSTLADPTQTAGAFFKDASSLQSVPVADGLTIQPGLRASDIGQSLMGSLKAIAEFDTSSGPINGQLTTAQQSFLTTQISALSSALGQVNDLRALNGSYQAQVTTVQSQHQDTLTSAQGLLSDLEEVDPAQAITNLNQDQTTLQAMYQTIHQINQVSLLNYLS